MTGALETTVTDLELVPPGPRRLAVPALPGLALMTVTDVPLHYYRYLMHRVGKPWNWVARLRLSDEDLSAIVHAATTDIKVLHLAGAPAGFFEIDRSGEGAVNIAYFGLMAHASGRGLGRWFLAEAIHAALKDQPRLVTVNTCTLDHPAALPLYQKLGFRPVGRRKAVIEPLGDADFVRLMRSV